VTATHAGRVAFVTGSASGIGQAVAENLAAAGAKVAVVDVADGSATVSACQAAGSEAVAIECDITDAESVAEGAKLAADLGPVDILVNCAGIYPMHMFDDIDWEEWRRVMSLNLDSLFHLSKALVPPMRKLGWGRIVNVASTTFNVGTPGFAHYTASKAGVIGFTRTLASEVGADGVTVNAVAPGLVRTPTSEATVTDEWFDIVTAGQAVPRTSTPEDLTGPIAFLTSDAAAFITGHTLVVDGGVVRT
jgi:NAD(P)-dependent dehydrogenase (short-subunit alcohol dehydrogenase family)